MLVNIKNPVLIILEVCNINYSLSKKDCLTLTNIKCINYENRTNLYGLSSTRSILCYK